MNEEHPTPAVAPEQLHSAYVLAACIAGTVVVWATKLACSWLWPATVMAEEVTR